MSVTRVRSAVEAATQSQVCGGFWEHRIPPPMPALGVGACSHEAQCLLWPCSGQLRAG